MELFIGIDQSINSTGVTVQLYSEENKAEHFFIITGDKLTKKAQKAQDTYKIFDYIIYDKHNASDASNNYEFELSKTYNLIYITDKILDIITQCLKNDISVVYVCMEGVSYNSSNTRSLVELSGLNYLIRYRLIEYFKDKSYNFNIIIAPPPEIKKFATGNGTAKKEIMISLFEASYPNLYLIPKIDDIADSYWMASYARKIYNDTKL